MSKTAFYGVEWLILNERTDWRGKVKNVFRRLWWKICRRYNAKQLEFICNLHPNYKGALTSDQAATLNAVAEYVKGDPFIVKNRNLVYRIPRIEDVTLWQVIEARRSETASEKVTKWCTPIEHEPSEYAPDNVYHLLCATKYIKEQIEIAYRGCNTMAGYRGQTLRDGKREGGEVVHAERILAERICAG